MPPTLPNTLKTHPVRTSSYLLAGTPVQTTTTSDDQIWTMLQTAANSPRIMPIVKGEWSRRRARTRRVKTQPAP